MLIGNDFVRAEDKYRREVLRDQYQTRSTGRVGKTVAALVVAGAIVLAACGTAVDTETKTEAATADVGVPAVVIQTSPKPQTLEERFSGVPAPDWHPKYGRLDLTQTVKRSSGPR